MWQNVQTNVLTMQEVWKTWQVSQEWRNAKVIPLFKKDRNRYMIITEVYIPLLSVLGKMLIPTLLQRLQGNIGLQLMEAQCGFRKGHSRVKQILPIRYVGSRKSSRTCTRDQSLCVMLISPRPAILPTIWTW